MNRRESRAAGQNPETASDDGSATAATPAALCELGEQHLRAGRVLDAQLCCREALAIEADHADALHLMGLLSLHEKQYDHAVEWLSRAIRREPRALFLTSLGTTLLGAGRCEEAVKVFDKAVQLAPDDADRWSDLGDALVEASSPSDAILVFQRVLTLDPNHFDATYKAALLLHQAGRLDEALVHFSRCEGLQPKHFPSVYMRAVTLQKLKRFEEALAANLRAHALDPGHADTCNNIGNVLRALARHAEAIEWFDRSLALRPEFAATLGNKAVALAELRRFDEAIAAYHAALSADPDHAVAAWNLALLQMLLGDFDSGWAGREARWKVPGLPLSAQSFAPPLWLGQEPIAGKTILIHQDEGLGDAIHFARYVPMLAALGANVVLRVNEALVPLLSKLHGVVRCVSMSKDAPPCDVHCPISSLPLVFGTRLETIPSATPYLPTPEPSRAHTWESRLGSHGKLRVGLVWSGNPRHNNDRNRSIALTTLAPILDLDATFVSLQKEMRPGDADILGQRTNVVDVTADLKDFSDTAALISCLDLVITVDTSVAHLAGALARPTWILLPYTPDYRWLLDRDDSPWYPTVRLFRQSEARDFAGVVERLRGELSARIAARSPASEPGDADSAYQAGFLSLQSGKPQEALASFEQSSQLRPNHAATHQMRALALHNLGRFEEAVGAMEQAHALDPADADICNNMGVFLRKLGRQEQAVIWFDKAVTLRPHFVPALNNKAYALAELRRFDEALAAYAAIKAIDPDNAEPDWNAAQIHLLTGNFAAGWAAREARWKVSSVPVRRNNFTEPMWLGKEPIAGKTILIHQDQGLGDAVQFARYVPMVAALGARVVLAVADVLVPLLSKLEGVAECVAMSDAEPSFDVHCPVSSLPLAFATTLETIPAAVPYLPAPEASRVKAWEDRLGPHDKLRIGLVWSGNPNHGNDRNRSITLQALAPLLDLDARFVSLQKDPRPDDREILRARGDIIDLTADLEDFVDTAALICCLDLVITVDTSVAHLAGAMARPTWMLLPYMPDWRWLLDRDDSPWYPTARLFRQNEARDYATVVARLRGELSARIAAWSPARELRDRGDADAAYRAGFRLLQSGKPQEALALFERASQLRPDHAATLQMRALTLQALGRYEEALIVMARAQALAPADAEICNNMGVFLRRLGRQDEAAIWFDKAVTLRPDFTLAFKNKAFALKELHRFDEALAAFAALKAADPDGLEPDWDAAQLHLLTGNFAAGWAAREIRWKIPGSSVSQLEFSQPVWLGNEPIAGKTILIYQDEGLGDVIQFARYVPMLAERGARVILHVADALVPLLSGLAGVAECLPRSVEISVPFDVRCPIMSLPLAFATRLETIPANVPYLPAPEPSRVRAWEDRLGPHDKLRVGLVWSGNPNHNNDRNRSIALQTLAPLLDLDARFVSLQKDPRPDDREILRARGDVADFTADLKDFADTAALVSCLDLIITVDTSMAHLAGALARPTWVLLPYTPDWRWLLDRDDSPWYPTARLFRQSAARDYGEVVQRLRSELRSLIAIPSPVATPGSRELVRLGNAAKREGRIEDAFRVLDKAVELDIESAEAWKALAQLLADMNRLDEAALSFQHVFKLDPSDADAACQAGSLFLLSGRLDEALALLDASDRLRPDHPKTLQLRALTLQNLGRLDEALAGMSRVHALDPDEADFCNDLGVVLLRLRRHREALPWFNKAIELRPDYRLAHNNKGHALVCLRRFDEAFAIYAALKAKDPDNAEPDWNAALLHLLTGNFEAGWAGREARWKVPGLPVARHQFAQPMWLGREPIAGRTILIYQDEGLGDVIQFARYVPMVAKLGARVILLVDAPLVQLLSKLPGVSECIPRAAHRTITFDFHCAIASLPLAFGTRLDTVPASVPYLPQPEPERVRAWEARLGPHDKMRIGLVWSGNPKHMDNKNRSMALRTLAPLLDLDATFVSLQKEVPPDDLATLGERSGILDLTAHLTDFAETAALVSCLDLVISVCTSTAHLAGALACPTWIMIQHTADWRWLLDRDDSPWYPTARLFRQTEPGNYADVVERVRDALRERLAAWTPAPNNAAADPVALLTSLGTALLGQGRHEEAVQAFDKAVQIKPDNAELWKNLGSALIEAKSPADAILSFRYALKLDPRHFDAAYQTALLLYEAGRREEALGYFGLCTQLQPAHFPSAYMQALTLQDLNRHDDAFSAYGRAHALDPAHADTCYSAGNVLCALNRYEGALAWYDKALASRPTFAESLCNKAVALTELRRFDEAIAAYRHAVAAGHARAAWNLALLHLLLGDFEAGWAGQEARWKVPTLSSGYPAFSQPKWLGAEPLAGRSLLVYANEGVGDTIQFARYVPMLAARGARVILVVHDSLCGLFESRAGVAQCLPKSAEMPEFDFHVPLSSLPFIFGTRLETIPAEPSYLPRPDDARVQAWEARLGARNKLRVGLVWAGNPNHGNDRNRSMPLHLLAPLLDLDASFVSLQKDPRPDDRARLAERDDIIDLTANLGDFEDTAELIACLDLVISVDTSVAHLAAALGCPTWILLPYTPDYRWLLDREDSPWYPTARLFRQDEARDYAHVVEHVRRELSARIAAWQPDDPRG